MSVNHYVKRARSGHRYVTAEATAYKQLLRSRAGVAGSDCESCWQHAKRYSIELLIFLGKGQKGDVDNFCKLPLDGLKEAGVIHSDDAVYELTVAKYRDAANPRTVIKVTAW